MEPLLISDKTKTLTTSLVFYYSKIVELKLFDCETEERELFGWTTKTPYDVQTTTEFFGDLDNSGTILTSDRFRLLSIDSETPQSIFVEHTGRPTKRIPLKVL